MSRNEIHQCKSCPWRQSCEPDRDIPNGYSIKMHRDLADTIIEGARSLTQPTVKMACHYSEPGDEFVCAGWLHHQLGIGNNFQLRMEVFAGFLPLPVVDGEQHERFVDTLPKRGRRRG